MSEPPTKFNPFYLIFSLPFVAVFIWINVITCPICVCSRPFLTQLSNCINFRLTFMFVLYLPVAVFWFLRNTQPHQREVLQKKLTTYIGIPFILLLIWFQLSSLFPQSPVGDLEFWFHINWPAFVTYLVFDALLIISGMSIIRSPPPSMK